MSLAWARAGWSSQSSFPCLNHDPNSTLCNERRDYNLQISFQWFSCSLSAPSDNDSYKQMTQNAFSRHKNRKKRNEKRSFLPYQLVMSIFAAKAVRKGERGSRDERKERRKSATNSWTARTPEISEICVTRFLISLATAVRRFSIIDSFLAPDAVHRQPQRDNKTE